MQICQVRVEYFRYLSCLGDTWPLCVPGSSWGRFVKFYALTHTHVNSYSLEILYYAALYFRGLNNQLLL